MSEQLSLSAFVGDRAYRHSDGKKLVKQLKAHCRKHKLTIVDYPRIPSTIAGVEATVIDGVRVVSQYRVAVDDPGAPSGLYVRADALVQS